MRVGPPMSSPRRLAACGRPTTTKPLLRAMACAVALPVSRIVFLFCAFYVAVVLLTTASFFLFRDLAAGMNPSFLQPEEPKTTVRAGEVSTFEVVLRDNIGGHFEFRICDGESGGRRCQRPPGETLNKWTSLFIMQSCDGRQAPM